MIALALLGQVCPVPDSKTKTRQGNSEIKREIRYFGTKYVLQMSKLVRS